MDLKFFARAALLTLLVVEARAGDLQTAYCSEDTDAVTGSRLVWPKTKVGGTHEQPCPNYATGFVKRCCLSGDKTFSYGVWGKADVKLCRNRKIVSWQNSINLDPEVKDRGDIYLEQIRFIMLNLVDMISEALDTDTLYPDDLLESVDILANISDQVSEVDKENINGVENLTMTGQVYLNVATRLICPDTHQIWLQFDDPSDIVRAALNIMDMVETFIKLIAGFMHHIRITHNPVIQGGLGDNVVTTPSPVITTYTSYSQFVDVEVRTVDLKQVEETEVEVGSYDTCAITSYPVAALKKSDGLYKQAKGDVFVYQAVFHSLEPLFTVQSIPNPRSPNEFLLMNSDIISSTVFGLEQGDLDNLTEPVIIKIRHQELFINSTNGCFFLNLSFSSNFDIWSNRGCEVAPSSNETYTECHCYHLTNFAILTDVFGVMDEIGSVHKAILSVISYVGGTLSMIGCTAAIVIFRLFKLKGEHIRCHIMFAASIVLSQLTFFFGVELTSNKGVCKFVTVLLHYVLTCMFCWMLIEGLHIYISLVKVFERKRYFKKYLLVGWGLPVIVVGCSALMFWENYGNENYCWLVGDALVAGFMPFVGFTIGCNCAILAVVIKVMMKAAKNPSRVKCSQQSFCLLKSSLRAAVILHPLLGLTWIFAFLSINPEYTLVFTYLFTVCNTLQGLMFFIFHCATNSEIKEAINGKWGDSMRTIRRVSSLWSVNTNFSDILDHKTGLPSCNTLSAGTLKPSTIGGESTGKSDGLSDELVARVSVDKLRRLSLAMADIREEIGEARNSVDLDDIIKCAEMMTDTEQYPGNIPDILLPDEPPSYDECVEATATGVCCSVENAIIAKPPESCGESGQFECSDVDVKVSFNSDIVGSSEA